jgi:trimethylamine--corrinoid protein Co-methyltransferase
MDSQQHRSRRPNRRRAAPAAAESGPRISAPNYRRLRNPFEPLKVLSEDELAHIHESALSILENDGMRVLLPEARARYAAAGASVDEAADTVRIDRSLIAAALSSAPSRIEMTAPNPERNVVLGGQNVAVVPVSGPPNASDLDRGRRPGTLRDLHELLKLAQSFDVIHLLGPSIEPQDIPPAFRHLESTLAQLTLSDKVPFVYSRGRPQVEDCFSMVRAAHGLSEEAFRSAVYTYTNINTNSPRQLDIPMAQGILDFAAAGQLLIITPFTLAGAMAPITVVGALALAHAEALAGITLAQITRPGAPVVYGGFTSNVDMKSGSPAFGTPEYVKASFGTGQLARHIGLPWRSSNATASNVADGQAVYESQMSLWGALLGGCNLERAHHAALQDGVLYSAGLRLAQLRPVARRRGEDGHATREHGLARNPRPVHGSASRPRNHRGAHRLCRTPQGGGRRGTGVLRSGRDYRFRSQVTMRRRGCRNSQPLGGSLASRSSRRPGRARSFFRPMRASALAS